MRALQYSGGWGRQSQERPVSVRALHYSGDVCLERLEECNPLWASLHELARQHR